MDMGRMDIYDAQGWVHIANLISVFPKYMEHFNLCSQFEDDIEYPMIHWPTIIGSSRPYNMSSGFCGNVEKEHWENK